MSLFVPTLRLDIAYNGAGFAGWAAQPGLRTVQEELERALERVLGERPRLTVAGRTDAGVHAWGQVASLGLADEPPEAGGQWVGISVIGVEPWRVNQAVVSSPASTRRARAISNARSPRLRGGRSPPE